MRLARPLENLINQLLKLPTIGPKTAQRLALFILKLPPQEAKELSDAIITARTKVFPCPGCGFLTDTDPCIICQDQDRDNSILCITEEASDIMAIERAGFRGRYLALNKDFHLLESQGLEDLDLTRFKEILNKGQVKEVILALNPDIDGEILSRFLASTAASFGVKVTYLARGLPVGGDIEFADEITLRRAIEGRKEI
ncbi:MAG: recombination mediator RecR [Syntrophomonadaceae bacterium]|jgi:recombination protein RecR